MAVKVKIKMPEVSHDWRAVLLRGVLLVVAACAATVLIYGGFLYIKYGRIVDERLQHPLFKNTAKIYAAPREVRPGQKLSIQLIADELRHAGYTTTGAFKPSPLGNYRVASDTINIEPGHSPSMHRMGPPFVSTMEWWKRSTTIMANSSPAMSWSR